ncbi:hypothetical protein DAPPUDRAFT_108217 [Daphnia pulex]|uniref:Vacuolar protein-sorting-associated protein 36 n=1 Tax=Daphnia pulex TaxID=6669 RepID=E9GZH8_DAPPU|nr:hypothetical protein DAPPUDRAFT_108217 [Daphnia pulex]|eukprot:EFX75148.1 hypothetical protein DAPPUDRAFT_108217 [Daphnia pulex]
MNVILDLKYVVLVEEDIGNLLRSSKIILHLAPWNEGQLSRPPVKNLSSFIKLAFSDGKLSHFKECIQKMLQERSWETVAVHPSILHHAPTTFRSGIVGIERRLQAKVENNSSNINIAFQDMQNLIDMAKDMVQLANVMSNKIKDRQGDISEDETVKFKSYLLSLGIDDPVTRNSCSSNDVFYHQLAKEIASFLLKAISDTGGLMAMSDAYCRVNRARGLELLSPEDFFKACNYMEKLNLPIICRKFDSGVLVLQLQSKTDSLLEKEVSRLLQSRDKLTALEVSQEFQISIVLAQERLYFMERNGLICRDDSVRGLVFYPNFFSSSA